jgi:hypothetical protein
MPIKKDRVFFLEEAIQVVRASRVPLATVQIAEKLQLLGYDDAERGTLSATVDEMVRRGEVLTAVNRVEDDPDVPNGAFMYYAPKAEAELVERGALGPRYQFPCARTIHMVKALEGDGKDAETAEHYRRTLGELWWVSVDEQLNTARKAK